MTQKQQNKEVQNQELQLTDSMLIKAIDSFLVTTNLIKYNMYLMSKSLILSALIKARPTTPVLELVAVAEEASSKLHENDRAREAEMLEKRKQEQEQELQ